MVTSQLAEKTNACAAEVGLIYSIHCDNTSVVLAMSDLWCMYTFVNCNRVWRLAVVFACIFHFENAPQLIQCSITRACFSMPFAPATRRHIIRQMGKRAQQNLLAPSLWNARIGVAAQRTSNYFLNFISWIVPRAMSKINFYAGKWRARCKLRTLEYLIISPFIIIIFWSYQANAYVFGVCLLRPWCAAVSSRTGGRESLITKRHFFGTDHPSGPHTTHTHFQHRRSTRTRSA